MADTTALDDLAAALVEEGTAAGAEEIEVYVCDEHTMGLRSSSGTLSASESHTRGAGVRVVRGRSVGFAYGSLPGRGATTGLVGRALAACSFNEPLETADPVLPEPGAAPPADARLWVPGVEAWSVAEARRSLARFVGAARSVPGGQSVPRCHYGVSLKAVAVAGSSGIRAGYRSGVHFLWGEVRDGAASAAGSCWARHPAELEAVRAATDAAEAVSRSTRASAPPRGGVPVVLAPAAASALVGRMAGPLTGGGNGAPASHGARVASAEVSVVDDATLGGALASAPVDDEGLAARRVELVRGGERVRTLTGAGRGHARRSSYRALPRPGASNLYVLPGGRPRRELLSLAGHGLLIEEVSGLAQVDSRSAGATLAVRGWRIREGEPAEPVAGPLPSSSLQNLLQAVRGVGDDLEFWPGKVNAGSPSLLIDASGFPEQEGER